MNNLDIIRGVLTYIVYTTSLGGGRGTSIGAAAHTFPELVTPSGWHVGSHIRKHFSLVH